MTALGFISNLRHWISERKPQRFLRWALWLGIVLAVGTGPVKLSQWQQMGVVLIAALVLLKSYGAQRIAVLTYHSVSGNGAWLNMPDLVMPLDSFKRQMDWLQQHGYRTLSLDEVHDQRIRGEYHDRCIALTFDDGYLDAWVAVAPVLRARRMRGTVFVSSGWVSTGDSPRPRLGEMPNAQLQWDGYLNREEIRVLAAEGTLAIQSHGHTHDRLFTGEALCGFVNPVHQPLWLRLLLFPQDRTVWYRCSRPLPNGYPLFNAGEALAVRAFSPHPALVRILTRKALEPGFCMDRDGNGTLKAMVATFKARRGSLGHFESAAQTRHRWRMELSQSRQILEQLTGAPVTHLCWPRSVRHPKAEILAREVGFFSVTAGTRHNEPGEPWRISRINISGIGHPGLDLLRFILEVRVFEGHYWLWPALWVVQRLMALVYRFQPRENL